MLLLFLIAQSTIHIQISVYCSINSLDSHCLPIRYVVWQYVKGDCRGMEGLL